MKTLRERFEEKYEPEPNTGCWLWTNNVSSNGYGLIKLNGRQARAHRVSYELNIGPIPSGLCVCHHCDTPICVNPGHLFLGTVADNVADMVAKGRQARLHGEAHGRAKVTAADVQEIRRRYASGDVSHRELAAKYGVCQTQTRRIVQRKGWAHI